MTEVCAVREVTEVCAAALYVHMSDIRTMVSCNYELRYAGACFTLAAQHHSGHHNLGGNDGLVIRVQLLRKQIFKLREVA